MAAKFITLDEAAKMLGISSEELNELRKKGEIHGLRDGSSWKFKPEEIERAAEERGLSLGGAESPADDDFDFGAEGLSGAGALDLDLTREGKPVDGAPTAIGTAEDLADLLGGSGTLASAEEKKPAAAKPQPAPKAGGRPPQKPKADDSLSLDDDSSLTLGDEGSDLQIKPATGSEINLTGDSSADVLGGTDPGLKKGAASDLDFEGSDLGMASDLTLSEDEELALGKESKPAAKEDSSDELALGDESELVLDGGSDVTRGAGDTGIGLLSPSDSGLNLEEAPVDLAGSSVSNLELPEDDEVALDELDVGPDEATKLRADEEFQLEPSGETEEDADDSGSQVIALEDSEALEAAAGGGLAAEEGLLGGPTDELEGALDQDAVEPVMQPAGPMLYAPLPETPYSIWNVLSLLGITVILTLTGMLMTDLVRNMWSWDQPFSATTPIMDAMVRLIGLEP